MSNQSLRFTPYAWAKLHWLCHYGDTEIGAFGVTHNQDPLLVEDVLLVQQVTTSVSVEFDDEGVANFFEDMVDGGREPQNFARIWCHTHPASSATPSIVDEKTFREVFGECDWSIMFILAKGGATYARISVGTNPKIVTEIAVEIDFSEEFAGSEHTDWAIEYHANVEEQLLMHRHIHHGGLHGYHGGLHGFGHAGGLHDMSDYEWSRVNNAAEDTKPGGPLLLEEPTKSKKQLKRERRQAHKAFLKAKRAESK